MGGGRGGPKRGRTQRKHFRQNRDNVWKKSRPDPSSNSDNPNWVPFITDNPGFEEYYKEQGIVAEDEWEEFMNVLKKPLPAAFRINSTGQFAEDVRTQLESEFMKSCESEPVDENVEKENGNSEPGIKPLPWYPEKFAWQVNYSRMQLRKNQTLERFHEFLKQENEIGNITRQEAVSMVPPLFLDVKSNHAILDMCAAPGSKTFQLLEMIHKSVKQGSLPQGLVIANDVDFRRCNLLIHQTKRMCSANLIVTNHEAQFYPSCHVKNSVFQKSDSIICGLAEEGFGSLEALGKLDNRELLFDRVLCDVPCSGDGTLRKAPDIWRKWNCGMGNGLHRLQVQIAMRGISLLKVGGRLVYSTCSINPVEDEAVVAELLRRCGGSVELLDVSAELPELIRHPGLKTWKVRDRGVWLRSYKESPSYRKGSVVPSMFPSGESWDSEKESVGQELEKPAVPNSTSYAEPEVDACSNAGVKDCHSSGPGEASGHTESRCLSNDDSENMQENKSSCPELMNEDVDINTKEVSSLPLERCMRILPHDQNGGAFFIAVLQKTFPLKGDVQHQEKYSSCEDVKVELEAIAEEASEQMSVSPRTELSNDHADLAVENPVKGPLGDEEEDVTSEAGFTDTCLEDNELEQECDNRPEKTVDEKDIKGKLQIQGKWKGVDPVIFLMDDATINSIIAFYGINESFPLRGHLVTRNDDVDHVKRIYYVSKSVQDILRLNFLVCYQLKITSVGLKMFERQTSREPSSPCSFRISSEGLPLLLPYMTKQVVGAPIVDFQNLLKYRTVKFSDISNADFEEKASKLSSGCCIVILDNGNSKSDAVIVDDSTIAIGCWKGRTNLSVMVSELECKELLERLCIRFSKREETTPEEDGSQGVS